MLNNLWTTLKALAASRKVMLAVISGLVYIGGRLGLHLDNETLLPIVSPLWGALFGTAVEDVAKHQAAGRVAVAAATSPASVTNVVNQPTGGAP